MILQTEFRQRQQWIIPTLTLLTSHSFNIITYGIGIWKLILSVFEDKELFSACLLFLLCVW